MSVTNTFVAGTTAKAAEINQNFTDVVNGTLRSKVITATRDLTAASGDVSYSGAGFTPTVIIMLGGNVGSTGSWGVADSSLSEMSNQQISTGDILTNTTALGVFSTGVATQQSCVLKTFDADGFTLTWTKTGSPTGTITLIFLCLR